MKYGACLIAWTPTDPLAVDVIPWPDQSRRSAAFLKTTGAGDEHSKQLSREDAACQVFADFYTLIVRDLMDLQTTHTAFLKIEEYREALALGPPDGADNIASPQKS